MYRQKNDVCKHEYTLLKHLLSIFILYLYRLMYVKKRKLGFTETLFIEHRFQILYMCTIVTFINRSLVKFKLLAEINLNDIAKIFNYFTYL